MKRPRNNYINNKDFYNAIVEYQEKCRLATEEGKQQPIMPKYLGECITQIANRLATKPNFRGYSYKEEMISDGILNCLEYFNNFNPEKSQNPFAYYTQIIYYAFLRRIEREKKALYTKYKAIGQVNLDASLNAATEDANIIHEVIQQSEGSVAYMENFIKDYEAKVLKKDNNDK